MTYLPPPVATTRHGDAASALAQVRRIYDNALVHLRKAMQRYVAGEDPPDRVRACYPFVRVQTHSVARAVGDENARLSYGFVAGPGRYETTLTRPDLFGDYYLDQFSLLLRNHGVELEVGTSHQPIPVHFSFAEHEHIEGNLSAQRRQLMRDTFDLPEGATLLASTDLYPHQAFAWGAHALALQFHIETSARGLERWFIGHAC